MALDSDNAAVAVTGAIYVAPTGTALPATAVAALNAAFKDLGYMSEDGVDEDRNVSQEKPRAWQNTAVLRVIRTESDFEVSFTMVETKKETVELFYGSALTDATGKITIDPAATGGRKAFVLDFIDGAKIERTVIAEGEVTEVGTVNKSSTGITGYPVTITAYTKPDRYYTDLIVP